MSGLVGRGSRSFKKKIVEQSLIPALGIKKVRFAHRAAAEIMPDMNGEITINFSTFIAPPEMVAEGFSNPSSTEITNLRVGQFRNNVRIESNLNGVLIDQIAYTITDTSFTLMDEYIITAGEIFVFTVGSNPVTGNRIVDARPLRASGDVDFSMIGSEVVNFEVGQGFRVAGSTINSLGEDNQQIGNVQVFVDGVLQFRNAGNGDEDSMAAAMQTGNYREIALDTNGDEITGVDYANAVRFNMGQPFSSTEGVLVVATNLIVDEPNGTGLLSIVDNNSANIANNVTDIASNVTDIATNATNISANTTAIENVSSETVVPTAVAQFVTAISPLANAETRSGGVVRSTIFSYTEATWVCPAEVDTIFVEMGGGGSSRNTAVSSGGTNGSAGAWYQGWHSVVAGQTYTLRLGNPGAGGTTTGQSQNGGPSQISGTLNGIASATIVCGGGLGPEGAGAGTAGSRGNVSFTNLDVGETRNDANGNYPTARDFSIDTNPAAQNWNKDGVWVSNAATGNAGRGGSTVRGLGGAFVGSEGGGGAGFAAGRDANVMSGRGGEGGIRITYYSNTASTITIGNNVING